VKFGSCDSYQNIGNGKYTPKNLVIGFNKYAEAVSSILPFVLPKLEAQGVRDMIFEGVQLTPLIVEPYLRNRNKLIILTTNEGRLNLNRTKLFGDDREMLERYSTDKLFILQNKIIKQSKLIKNSSFTLVKNNNDYHTTANVIIEFLEKADVIETLTDNK
jgi:2-phosphoglycerate kinase